VRLPTVTEQPGNLRKCVISIKRCAACCGFTRRGSRLSAAELDHRVTVERNQNPAKPCGLLWGILTLVISLSEPSGCVA
jgi:hypothetical protein